MIRTLYQRRTSFALPLLLVACTLRTLAAELPEAPQTPVALAPTTAASLTGAITDTDGAAIPNAHISITQPAAPTATTLTTPEGHFTFINVAPGPYTLSITADGFSLAHIAGNFDPGATSDLPAIVLTVASSTNINVNASQTDIAQAQVEIEEKQRVLGVFPNFYVSYLTDSEPLNAKQKYQMALVTMVDPVTFVFTGAAAGIQQADHLFNWGQGAQAFGKRYAAAYGTVVTSTLLGNAVLPVLLKQDPRYFYKTDGTVPARVLYALAMSVVCRGDNQHWQPDYSGIGGGAMASALSNLYYPAVNRSGTRLILEGTAIGIGASALQNVIQQFLVRRLTPHTHDATLAPP
ncbi:MAG TPA: carboxypeptidase-like regulatory domain-containing protein [Acidobacteriaceae bacterium]|nr:carboxypeptidase-like regulatory domain-containing protein [Acidobacteriaceae bacterium]